MVKGKSKKSQFEEQAKEILKSQPKLKPCAICKSVAIFKKKKCHYCDEDDDPSSKKPCCDNKKLITRLVKENGLLLNYVRLYCRDK